MINLYNNFIFGPSSIDKSNFLIAGSDSYESYQENLKTQPQDWIYRTKSVTYERNEFGHRSKNLQELSYRYGLFTGCSITFGSAVALEDSYPHKISKALDVDYYNLAVEGSGPDLVAYNLMSWLYHVEVKPSFIVLQWPEYSRCVLEYSDDRIKLLGPWVFSLTNYFNDKDREKFSYALKSEMLEHVYKILSHTVVCSIKSMGIPIVELETSKIKMKDTGRDLKHPGIKTHSAIADDCVSFLKSQRI